MIVHNSNRLLTESQYRFPVGDVENVISVPGIRAHFHAFALQIKGHEDLRFEFWKQASRDEVSHFWGNSRTDAIKGYGTHQIIGWKESSRYSSRFKIPIVPNARQWKAIL